MSESEASSESEPEFESIIATRARRSNAGSRLRQLLDLEETTTGSAPTNEDDENVNLLFMEDEDDREFRYSEDEEEASGNETGEEEDHDEDKAEKKSKMKQSTKSNKKIVGTSVSSDNEEQDVSEVNSDEMLSDSDISASDSDESEGERELRKQELLKKRRKRKAGLPSILQKKKAKTSSTEPTTKQPRKSSVKSHRSNIFDSVPIAPYQRRHSARKTTLQNSIATHEKMEKEYEKRQSQAPVVTKEYVEKTLEERLEEAKITEKENTLSLTRFYEQEIQKKKKQRDLANSRKFRLTNFIRFLSTGIYITPMDEVRQIEEEEQRIKEEEENRNKRKLQYLKRKQARLAKTGSSSPSKVSKDEKTEAEIIDNTSKENVKEAPPSIEVKQEQENKSTEENEIVKNEAEESKTPIKSVRFSENPVSSADDQDVDNISKNDATISDTPLPDEKKAQEEHVKTLSTLNSEPSPESSVDYSTNHDISKPVKEEENEFDKNNSVCEDEDKIDESKAAPKILYEGPPQHVTRNYVMFEEFDESLTSDQLKTYLFGQQAVLKGTHRDPQYETLCIIKQDESSNIDLHKIQAMRDESFKLLIQLPKFGEKIIVTDDGNGKSEEDENEVVQIHTPAPVGIHLPNGQKKICPTSGTPAMYYDPTNGVPYATVDAFRILKSLVEGEYHWLQLDNGGINSRFKGGIGCYIGKKNQRHAAGVPEGFS